MKLFEKVQKLLIANEKGQEIVLIDLTKVLSKYNLTHYDAKNSEYKITGEVNIQGQKMNRIFVKEISEDEVIVYDGWKGELARTTKEKVSEVIDRVFNGEFGGVETNRLFTNKHGVVALY